MSIPVIIPVFNRPEYSQVCLDSLFEADHGCRIQPIIVDNGSRNRTKTVLQQYVGKKYASMGNPNMEKPSIVTIPCNGGFAMAVNEGLKFALALPGDSPIVILHNDTVVFDGWAKEMMDCLQTEDEEVAVVMPRTNYANEQVVCMQEVRERFLGVKPSNKMRVSSEDILGLFSHVYPEGRSSFLEKIKNTEDIRTSYSPEVASFCMMIRRSIATRYPTWDVDFFPRGYEDKFWFLPLEREGYVCMICNYAYVHHFGNITSDGPGFNFVEVCQINRERFISKVKEMDRRNRQGLPGVLAEQTQLEEER